MLSDVPDVTDGCVFTLWYDALQMLSQVTIEEVGASGDMDDQRELPAFGAGIEFRPQQKSAADNSERQPPNDDQSRPAAAVPGLSFLQDDPMDEDAGGTANTQLRGGGIKPPRQRNYRSRS